MTSAEPKSDPVVDAILNKAREVAVLPQVVFKIMDLTGAETSSSARELERAIMVDPGFSAKILTIANSAYFALPRKVPSIREAIMFVGFKSVRELAMTIGVFDLFLGKTDRGSLRRRAWWRTSLDAAVCAKALAPDVAGLNPDEAYTCALLHSIGKTMMDRTSPADYQAVEELMEQGAPDYLAESAIFGCDHMQVNQAACRSWGFPEELVAALEYVHEPLPGPGSHKLKAMTAACARLAKFSVEGRPLDDEELLFPRWVNKELEVSIEKVQEWKVRGATAVAEAKHLLR